MYKQRLINIKVGIVGYDHNVIPFLTSATTDFDGFCYNKIKNALTYLNNGYQGGDGKANKKQKELDNYILEVKNIKDSIERLKTYVRNRKKKLSDLINDANTELSELNEAHKRIENYYIPETGAGGTRW